MCTTTANNEINQGLGYAEPIIQGVICTVKLSKIDYKTPLIAIGFYAALGWVLNYFTDLGWLAATLFLMVVFFINGIFIFLEDREPGGWDYIEGVTDTEENKKSARKVVVGNSIVICVLLAILLWVLA